MSPLENKLRKRLFGVILCAGKGKRLKGMTLNNPKPLLKFKFLNNRTILDHTIGLLRSLGIEKFAIIIGYLGNKIEKSIKLLSENKRELKDKIFVIDTEDRYKLGPLYSFLSIIKNSQVFKKSAVYMIIPGDTVFQVGVLKAIFQRLTENSQYIEKAPLIFYRVVSKNRLEKICFNKFRSISIINLKKNGHLKSLKDITQISINNLKKGENVKQIIPAFIFAYEFILKHLNIVKSTEIKTIREWINCMSNEGQNILCFEIPNKYNFYDIDYQADILNIEKLSKEKKRDK